MLSREEIGIKLKEKRLELGLTQTELAKELLSSVDVIYQIERNKYKPKSMKLYRRFCKRLEIKIEEDEK